MEHVDPVAAYNDFLRLTLDHEQEARDVLQALFEPRGRTCSESEVYELAEILAVASFHGKGDVPTAYSERKKRHDLRGAFNRFVVGAAILHRQDKVTHADIISCIDAIGEKFNAVMNSAKNSAHTQ